MSHYKLYQKLTTLRKEEALTAGSLETKILSDDVLTVARHGTNKTVILLINFDDKNEKTVNVSDITKNYKTYTVYASSIGSNTKWE